MLMEDGGIERIRKRAIFNYKLPGKCNTKISNFKKGMISERHRVNKISASILDQGMGIT